MFGRQVRRASRQTVLACSVVALVTGAMLAAGAGGAAALAQDETPAAKKAAGDAAKKGSKSAKYGKAAAKKKKPTTGPAAGADDKFILPYIGDNTFLVARLDVARIDLDAYRLDIAGWLDTHGSAGLEHVDVAAAVEDLTRIVRDHRLRMPPDVAMLGKTLIQLQGDLSIAGAGLRIPEALHGYESLIIRRRVSPERLLRRARRSGHDWDRLVQQAPRDVSAIRTFAGVT